MRSSYNLREKELRLSSLLKTFKVFFYIKEIEIVFCSPYGDAIHSKCLRVKAGDSFHAFSFKQCRVLSVKEEFDERKGFMKFQV